MQLKTQSYGYSRDFGYLLLEQGKSNDIDFEKMDKSIAGITGVTPISGDKNEKWVDFAFDKSIYSFGEIKQLYKAMK